MDYKFNPKNCIFEEDLQSNYLTVDIEQLKENSVKRIKYIDKNKRNKVDIPFEFFFEGKTNGYLAKKYNLSTCRICQIIEASNLKYCVAKEIEDTVLI